MYDESIDPQKKETFSETQEFRVSKTDPVDEEEEPGWEEGAGEWMAVYWPYVAALVVVLLIITLVVLRWYRERES